MADMNEQKRLQYARMLNWRIAALSLHLGSQCPQEIRQDTKRAAIWVRDQLRTILAKKETTSLRNEIQSCEEIIEFYERNP